MSRQNLSDMSHDRTPLQQISSRAPRTPFTPYGNRNRSLCYLQAPPDADTRRQIKKLSRFLNSAWHIYHVSPLFNWRNRELDLKRYSRCIRDQLLGSSDDDYKVAYSVVENLHLSDSDHAAVEVTVDKIKEGNHPKLVYTGTFLSWGADGNFTVANAICLPILLCKGRPEMVRHVHAAFEKLHDCVVTPFILQEEDICSLTVAMFEFSDYKDDHSLELSYTLPKRPALGEIQIELPAEFVSRLWSWIHNSGARTWNFQEVINFWDEVHTGVENGLELCLNLCTLDKVVLPNIAFSRNKVKPSKQEALHFVLRYLMASFCALESEAPALSRAPEQLSITSEELALNSSSV